jgi:hypothetical protein
MAVNSQLGIKKNFKRKAELTKSEIKEYTEETKIYKAVGRM